MMVATEKETETELNMNKLDADVARCKERLDRCPPLGLHRCDLLTDLAAALVERFGSTGAIDDIDPAVTSQRQAVRLCALWNPRHTTFVGNLGNMLLARFTRLGQMEDMNESIECHRKVLRFVHRSHAGHRTALNNLAASIHKRFQEGGDPEDIDEAIRLHCEALALHPAPHPDRASSLHNLASSIHGRFQQRGDTEDIDEAIGLHREALALRPAPHPNRAGSLNNLAASVQERFQQQGDTEDIDEAICLYREALALVPAPHPGRAASLKNLANCLLSSGSLTTAIQLLQEASADSSASLLVRFQAAKQWATEAHENHHLSALEAYRTALGLLPQLAAFSLNVQSRQAILVEAQSHNIGSDAAACAIDLGEYKTAIELLEAGRSVFWAQSLHLRTSLDDLQVSHPFLATKLAELSWKLEQSSFRDASRTLGSDGQHTVMSIEAEALNCRRLNDELVQTVESVRSSVPGFEDFMRPKGISKLRLAAERGPVVVLNAGELSCHALILDSSDKVHCVTLPGMTRKFLDDLTQMMQALVSGNIHPFLATLSNRGHDLKSTDRLIGRLVYEKNLSPDDWFHAVLDILWINIVKPVIQFLQIKKSENPSRLWWCPTGAFTFLPIHAAGKYDRQSQIPIDTVADYVISSYTPTLTALLSGQNHCHNSAHLTWLPALALYRGRIAHVEKIIPKEWLTSLGTVESPATVETVLQHLQTSSIIHFACHGIQDKQKPLQSALLIDSDRLTMSQIMKTSGFAHDRPENPGKHLGLAFLSACQTASGDKKAPDEAMHLAATLLFAGFRSVVATMWTIRDPDGPAVAEVFYGHLFRNTNPASNPPVFPDLNESAEALHLAVKKLRTKVPFVRWVPFVHYGL